MRRGLSLALQAFVLACIYHSSPATAAVGTDRDSALCEAAIVAGARNAPVPQSVLHAISLTETGRHAGGRLRPWPWAINREGRGHWFKSRNEALAFARKSVAEGRHSFDVGCFQINYRWHGHNFPSLEAMFDPETGAAYAARFLGDLHRESGDWSVAAGSYHSRTPHLARIYRARFDRILANLSGLPADIQVAEAETAPQRIRTRMTRGPLIIRVEPRRADDARPAQAEGRMAAIRSDRPETHASGAGRFETAARSIPHPGASARHRMDSFLIERIEKQLPVAERRDVAEARPSPHPDLPGPAPAGARLASILMARAEAALPADMPRPVVVARAVPHPERVRPVPAGGRLASIQVARAEAALPVSAPRDVAMARIAPHPELVRTGPAPDRLAAILVELVARARPAAARPSPHTELVAFESAEDRMASNLIALAMAALPIAPPQAVVVARTSPHPEAAEEVTWMPAAGKLLGNAR